MDNREFLAEYNIFDCPSYQQFQRHQREIRNESTDEEPVNEDIMRKINIAYGKLLSSQNAPESFFQCQEEFPNVSSRTKGSGSRSFLPAASFKPMEEEFQFLGPTRRTREKYSKSLSSKPSSRMMKQGPGLQVGQGVSSRPIEGRSSKSFPSKRSASKSFPRSMEKVPFSGVPAASSRVMEVYPSRQEQNVPVTFPKSMVAGPAASSRMTEQPVSSSRSMEVYPSRQEQGVPVTFPKSMVGGPAASPRLLEEFNLRDLQDELSHYVSNYLTFSKILDEDKYDLERISGILGRMAERHKQQPFEQE